MKAIMNLDTIRIEGQPLQSPLTDIDLEAGLVRVPLLFLVDVSGSMSAALPVINKTLTSLMEGIYKAEGAEKYMVDFSIITFGGNGVVIERDFDLLKKGEIFQIKQCTGITPLGEAMLYAYYYSAKRKQQYKEKDLSKYNQPTVVLITDFYENSSRSSVVNNQAYSGNLLYDEMAELYSESYSNTYKQYTYSITPNGLSINTTKRDQLKVDIVDTQGVDIAQVLKRVISEYKASLAQTTSIGILEAVVAASDDFAPANNESEYSSRKLSKWQTEAAQRVNPLEEVELIEC
jgi:hypothetical protein